MSFIPVLMSETLVKLRPLVANKWRKEEGKWILHEIPFWYFPQITNFCLLSSVRRQVWSDPSALFIPSLSPHIFYIPHKISFMYSSLIWIYFSSLSIVHSVTVWSSPVYVKICPEVCPFFQWRLSITLFSRCFENFNISQSVSMRI